MDFVSSVDEALPLIAAHAYDLVLADMKMPEKNGP